jgi:hypothetical protein
MFTAIDVNIYKPVPLSTKNYSAITVDGAKLQATSHARDRKISNSQEFSAQSASIV